MTVIGITGPTGAGKTTVLHVLADMGGAIVDCDALYHELLGADKAMGDELRARFGTEIFDQAGRLRRKELGAIVFGDADALAALNAITHRYVVRAARERIARAAGEGRAAIALDAIALLESGLGGLCRETVAVTAPERARLRRVMEREGVSEQYARLRLSAQKPDAWFEARCRHTLRNDGDRAALEARARALFEQIIVKEEL